MRVSEVRTVTTLFANTYAPLPFAVQDTVTTCRNTLSYFLSRQQVVPDTSTYSIFSFSYQKQFQNGQFIDNTINIYFKQYLDRGHFALLHHKLQHFENNILFNYK